MTHFSHELELYQVYPNEGAMMDVIAHWERADDGDNEIKGVVESYTQLDERMKQRQRENLESSRIQAQNNPEQQLLSIPSTVPPSCRFMKYVVPNFKYFHGQNAIPGALPSPIRVKESIRIDIKCIARVICAVFCAMVRW